VSEANLPSHQLFFNYCMGQELIYRQLQRTKELEILSIDIFEPFAYSLLHQFWLF